MSDVPVRIRAFFALWPDERALAAVRRTAQQVAHERGGRASRDENLHVTVAFIGDVASVRLFALREAGNDAARASRAFELTLDRVGGAAHGIAWLAPNAVPAELHVLRDVLVERLEEAGFPTERRAFRPHVTLARNCPRLVRRTERPPVIWLVKRLSLVASTLAPGGSRYEELATWPLGDGGSA